MTCCVEIVNTVRLNLLATTGIVDISWYDFWSNEVYRHSFSTACCHDFLGDSINEKKKLCACCGRKIDYSNVIKKELHETV